jgi:O-glycosyl hydrolase
LLTVVALLALAGAALASGPEHAVRVDLDARRQTIEGFGTSIIGWLRQMTDLYETEQFQRIYLEEAGCSMLRVNMWGPVLKSPVEDVDAIRWQDFDNAVDRNRQLVYLNFAKALKKLDPEVRIIGTVWSPPAWMKMNRRLRDYRSGSCRADGYRDIKNRVDPKYYPHFVKWIVEMAKQYRAVGAPFYAISPGNEVQFTQTFESCVWNGADFAKIVEMLGDELKKAGLDDVKIFGPETMTSHFYRGGTGDYIKAIADRPRALEYLHAFATHGYDDGVKAEMEANSSARLWKFIEQYRKPLWMTEGGTGGHRWPEPIRKGVATAAHNALVAGNSSAFVPWQITERKESTHGLMVMARSTPKTFAAAHYFRYVRPGAVRVEATPAFGDVLSSAFVHEEDNTLTMVLINTVDEIRDVSISFSRRPGMSSFKVWRTSKTEGLAEQPAVTLSGSALQLAMPGMSMVTLFGRGERRTATAAVTASGATQAPIEPVVAP